MRVLITAGPTREPIDAVRFISNRSSGKIGFALANAACEAGHDVTLLLGPVTHESELNDHCATIHFETTEQLWRLLEQHFPSHDVLIMAAAVADYRVAETGEGKLPRDDELNLELVPTVDLVASIAETKNPHQRVIAFALEETYQMESRATEKMRRKGVDAIVANPLNTMDDDSIESVYITNDGPERPGRMSKKDFATWLIKRISR